MVTVVTRIFYLGTAQRLASDLGIRPPARHRRLEPGRTQAGLSLPGTLWHCPAGRDMQKVGVSCIQISAVNLKGRASQGRRFAAALVPRLFGKNPRSHHKGATGRIRTGDQLERLPVLCHCQLGQDSVPMQCALETTIRHCRGARRINKSAGLMIVFFN